MNFKVYCKNIKDTWSQKRGGDLNIYYGRVDDFLNKIPEFYNYLSENEKTRANRFKFDSDFHCYVSVHALLRIELSKFLNMNPESIKIEESGEGKPYLSEADLPFSLSRNKYVFSFVIGREIII